MATLKSGDFALEIQYATNAAYICVNGGCYSGKSQIYCTREEYKQFVNKIAKLYETLKEGEAKLQEMYEYDFLSFKSDGLGHFIVSGEFNCWGKWGLKFTETIDQTYFKDFIKQLTV